MTYDNAPDPRGLMDFLPQEERSTLAQYFYRAVRRGNTEPPSIVAVVRLDLLEHQRQGRASVAHGWSSEYTLRRLDHCRTWLALLQEQQIAAEDFAAYVVAREQLPRGQREAEKAARAVEYRRAAMGQQPATEKQLAYLRTLGWQDGAGSKAEASALIDRLLEGRT